MRRLTAGLLSLGLLTSGCALLSSRSGPSERQAEAIIVRAVEMAEGRDAAGAIAYAEQAFGPVQEPEVAFRRHFTLGWLHSLLAETASDEPARSSAREQAVAHYRSALVIRPGHADVSDNLASVLRRLERPGAAIDSALATRPDDAEVSDELANVRWRMERHREAIDVLEDVPAGDSTDERERAYQRRLAIGDLRVALHGLDRAMEERQVAHGEGDEDPGIERDELERALEEYGVAHDDLPGDEDAPLRIVVAYSLFGQDGRTGWETELEVDCREFATTGTPHVARRGYELLMSRSIETGQAELGTRSLEAWLRLESKARTLSLSSLERLPPPADWPNPELEQLRALVAWAEAGLQPVKETNGGGEPHRSPSLDDLDLSEWLLPVRRQMLVLAMRSLALRCTAADDYGRAADLYWFALRRSPPLELYETGGALSGEKPVAFLDLAPDLGVLLQNHAESVADPALTLEAVLAQVRPAFEEDDGARLLAVDPAAVQRFHTVFGLIYADRGAWGQEPFGDPWQQAPPHLRRAMEVALVNPKEAAGHNGRPLPHLARILAEGLAGLHNYDLPDGLEVRAEEGEAATRAYLGSAVGYFDLDDGRLAREMFERGERLAGDLASSVEDDVRATERILGIRRGGFFPTRWLESGWYLSGAASYFNSDLDEDDFQRELMVFNPNVATSFEDEELGGKVLIGYQFEKPFAVELGYTNMGEIKSDVTVLAPVSPNLISEIEQVHPILGDGFTLALRTNVWGGGPLTVTARVGAWAWDANKRIRAQTPSGLVISKLDERGFDLFFGVGAILGEWRRLSATFEYERYFFDGDGVDSLSVGVVYAFGK